MPLPIAGCRKTVLRRDRRSGTKPHGADQRSLAEQNGVTEQLKADNQMEWVRQMNACKAQAEEIVKAELIYD